MASLFKRTNLEPIPAGATIGGGFAKWLDAGKPRKARVKTTRTGDKIVTGQSALWYGKIRHGCPPSVQWETVSLYTDKTASERRLNELQRDADNRSAGVVTAEMDNAQKPLAEHVKDYLAALKQTGVADEHHRIASWMMNRVVELGGWKRLADVNADSLRVVVAKLTADGKTTSYCNKFVSRAKAFIHWMQANNRMTGNPLAGVKRGNVNRGKKTRARRAMEPEELRALLAATPEHRRIKYQFAALSGLRRGELADLRWGDLRLNAVIPFIQLREEQTKNAKADAVPLHPALVKMLAKLPVGDTDAAVLGAMPDMKTMVNDLTRAGLSLTDARQRRIDFHSLRHTFKTAVERTGCTQAVSDALTRHGDKTVADGYRHAELAEMLETLKRIPDLTPDAEAAAQRATGTFGVSAVCEIAHQGAHQGAPLMHQNSGFDGARLATTGNTIAGAIGACDNAQTPYNAALGDNGQLVAMIGNQIERKSFAVNNLRPSTQVD